MLLFQERIPKVAAFYVNITDPSELQTAADAAENPIRLFSIPDTPNLQVQSLSNGSYQVMVTNAGGGYSR
jgi:cyclic beta-1,2-glucan synthetase